MPAGNCPTGKVSYPNQMIPYFLFQNKIPYSIFGFRFGVPYHLNSVVGTYRGDSEGRTLSFKLEGIGISEMCRCPKPIFYSAL